MRARYGCRMEGVCSTVLGERCNWKGEHTRLACGVLASRQTLVPPFLYSPFEGKSQFLEVLAGTARTARETRALPKTNPRLRADSKMRARLEAQSRPTKTT